MLANCGLRTPQAVFQQGQVAPLFSPPLALLPPAPRCRSFCHLKKFSGDQYICLSSIRCSKLHGFHLISASSASNIETSSTHDEEIKAPKPFLQFPLARGIQRVRDRFVNTLLSAGKWLLVVIAVQHTVSEVAYAVVHEQELLIPLGMLAGVAFAGTAGETFVELFGNGKHRELPFYLLMLFFGLIKLIGPALPRWGLVFLPQFANAGLWWTWLWRKRQKGEFGNR